MFSVDLHGQLQPTQKRPLEIPFQSRVDRSVVRERCPTFEGAFVETCLLVVGKISGVWARLGGSGGGGGGGGGGAIEAGRPLEASPLAESVGCMLDMVVAPAGVHEPSPRVSAREAFRSVRSLVARGMLTAVVLAHVRRVFYSLQSGRLRSSRIAARCPVVLSGGPETRRSGVGPSCPCG